VDRREFTRFCVAALGCITNSSRSAESDELRVGYFGDPIDVGDIPLGGWQLFLIDGQPIYVRRRTSKQIEMVRGEPWSSLPDPARDEDRAVVPEWLVVSGECTHAGCRVIAGMGPYEGWECFCHGSQYDLSGRVRQGPALRNLPVLRYDVVQPAQLRLYAP
jgi:ubiquinol-cytochrome c reductase iron-sulfur subunit